LATTKRNFVHIIWDSFCSLKLTIFLLISLALSSIIGTVLPQGQLPPEYLAQISPVKLQIYAKLGFFDMYHSWWFIALLYIFSLNLISCSIKRLPHVIKFITEPTLVLGESMRSTFSLKKEIRLSAPVDVSQEKLAAFLGKEFATPVISEHSGEYHLFAQKSAWSRLGVYVVHLSILVIFVGAIIGSLFGYKGFVTIVEGSSISSVESRSGNQIPLGFELRCDQFSVTFYNTGAPKEFKSILTVLENGQPIKDYTNARVVVNDPLTYKGITFYQSSYGQEMGKMYTGLQVAKDPGVWVVWLGCTMMIIGIFVAFFMSHKRVWIIVSKGHARMYANASKNQAAFQMQFENLSELLNNLKI